LLTNHNKMLESQTTQQASSSCTPLGRSHKTHEPNPKVHGHDGSFSTLPSEDMPQRTLVASLFLV